MDSRFLDTWHADHLGVKDVADCNALLVEESSCRLTAVMKDLDNVVVLQQGMEALHLQVTPLLLHIKSTAPLNRAHLQDPYKTVAIGECVTVLTTVWGLAKLFSL